MRCDDVRVACARAAQLDSNPYLTFVTYAVLCLVFLGLREVAVSMADPFGDDDVDFDLERMLSGAYKNAVALLQDQRASSGAALPDGVHNPVVDARARFTVAPSVRS